ncbi:MAG TPA: hypothetical protein VGM82_01095 [Gemmatimonadaceae bacterium]
MRRHIARALCVMLVMTSACFFRTKPGEEAQHEPIPVRVRNENFLDVNVYANVGSVSRRLGMVTGNSVATFTIDWSATIGQPIYMTAIPIGGGGARATSQGLNVGYGQMIFFTVGSVLRQSTASVGDPGQTP